MWNEKAIRLNPFKRCECGKIHILDGNTSPNAKCSCGASLYDLAWERKKK